MKPDPKLQTGYFYGLNDQTAEEAYIEWLDNCWNLSDTPEEALAHAEDERSEGNFYDDDATVRLFKATVALVAVKTPEALAVSAPAKPEDGQK